MTDKYNFFYAIRNIKTGKYVSGTNYRYRPPHQISANEWRPPLLFAPRNLLTQIRLHSINMKRYEAVKVYMPKEQKNDI